MFGMNRWMDAAGYTSAIRSVLVAARIDTTPPARPPMSAATSSSCLGLWHRTSTSERSATSALDPSASPPSSSASARAFSASRSCTSTGSPIPLASADAMFPAPMRPSFIAPEAYPATGSALVEEALLDQPRALLGRHLDVARREQEHLVGDPLHAAVQRVGESGGEVDQALRELGVGALEVQDHRHGVLELVRDLLGVVEALGDDEMNLDVPATAAAAVAADRPQHARLAAARRLVGEDVVELVAPAPLKPPDVRPLAVPVLQLGLGLRVGHRLVARVLLLGQAEVDERAMPCVAKRHTTVTFERKEETPCYGKRSARTALLCRFRHGVADGGHVAVVGAAASAEHREPRELLLEGHVASSEVLRVALVQLVRLVELGVALGRGVGAHASDPLGPRRSGVEHAGEVARVGAVDHVVGGRAVRLVVDLLDRLPQSLAARQPAVCFDRE